VPGSELTFPLVPRRRLIGLSFGGMQSARRGTGSDVAGSRPYHPGDDVDLIDWSASARISSARGTDEFVVRQTYADEAPRVVVLCDRRPQMQLHEPPLPWLSKASAMRHAVELICESAANARGFIGYLDYASGEPFWRPPKSERELWQIRDRHLAWPDFAAPQDNLDQALDYLAQHRLALPPGSFLFVLSDFLSPPDDGAWTRALGHLWDVVPVVIQDPLWEQSFPDVAGLVIPFRDPVTGQLSYVRLSRKETRLRREQNEARRAAILDGLIALGLEPVTLSSSDPEEILSAFLEWAEQRAYRRGRLW
jgi:uncharacterized protein (DUF58 family)